MKRFSSFETAPLGYRSLPSLSQATVCPLGAVNLHVCQAHGAPGLTHTRAFPEDATVDAHRDRCNGLHALADHFPEPREDDARTYERDPVFDWENIDEVWDHTLTLSQSERLLYQECRKVQGKVVGRHDAYVATPWYMTAEFVAKRLQCSAQEAIQLADAWAILDADEPMVERFLAMSKGKLPQAIAYFTTLATAAAEAESVAPDDALHHPSDGLAHNLPSASPGYERSPEWLLLVSEGVPSAALIAHRLRVSLAQAGDIRETVALQAFGEAIRLLPTDGLTADEDLTSDQEPEVELDDAEDLLEAVSADLEEQLHQLEAVELGAPRLEGWHLLDELDEGPTWLDRQPASFQVLLHQIEAAPTLAALKGLGRKLYARQPSLTADQRHVMWSSWQVRRAAILAEVVRRQRPVAKAVAKLAAANGHLRQLGQRLYTLQKYDPQTYTPEGWTAIWAVYKHTLSATTPAAPTTRERVQTQLALR